MGFRAAADRCHGIWLSAVLALLAAGVLGVAHRSVHVGPPALVAGGVVAPSDVGVDAAGAPHRHRTGPFDQHDDGSAQCRLLDQLLHLDSLWPADATATALAPAIDAPGHAVCGRLAAAAPRHYLARAPPRA